MGLLHKLRTIFCMTTATSSIPVGLTTTKAPYLASLIGRYGLATNYDAVWQKSQPNYLALFSGSTHDITDDQAHDLAGPDLADQIDASGRSWSVFAENVPGGCFAGLTSSGGPDGRSGPGRGSW